MWFPLLYAIINEGHYQNNEALLEIPCNMRLCPDVLMQTSKINFFALAEM